MAYAEKPIFAPGSQFLYSDVNFIVLGALVERVSGTSLDQYCRKNIFLPLNDDAHAFSAAGGVVAENCAHAI